MLKSLLCLLIVTVNNALAPTTPEFNDGLEYSRYIGIPDGEGVMHTVDLEGHPDVSLLDEVERHPAHNHYSLYTKQYPADSQVLSNNNLSSIVFSNFNAYDPTTVVVHGWNSNQFDNICIAIRNAFFEKKNMNVIVMDWSRLSMSDYVTATSGVPAVGRALAQFLTYVNKITGQDFSNMHLVGFDLGAHIVGNAGRELGGAIARITALDPAGPLWNYNPNRIESKDAIYVEAIHTNGGATAGNLGIKFNVGNADFYPNGGASQPGCVTHVCNHNRAWELFASSLKYNHFIGRQCGNNLELAKRNCHGPKLHMGNDNLIKTGYGIYFLTTYTFYPF